MLPSSKVLSIACFRFPLGLVTCASVLLPATSPWATVACLPPSSSSPSSSPCCSPTWPAPPSAWRSPSHTWLLARGGRTWSATRKWWKIAEKYPPTPEKTQGFWRYISWQNHLGRIDGHDRSSHRFHHKLRCLSVFNLSLSLTTMNESGFSVEKPVFQQWSFSSTPCLLSEVHRTLCWLKIF